MPEEKNNPHPTVTREEWEGLRAQTPREVAAARRIVSREIRGLYERAYLTGQSDHAPVLRGVQGFASRAYSLSDAIDAAGGLNSDQPPTAEEWSRIVDANAEVVAAMEHFEL